MIIHLVPTQKKSLADVWVAESTCGSVRICFTHTWRWGYGQIENDYTEEELEEYLEYLTEFEEVDFIAEASDGVAFDFEILRSGELDEDELREAIDDMEDVYSFRDECDFEFMGYTFNNVTEYGEVYGPYDVWRMGDDGMEQVELLKVVE